MLDYKHLIGRPYVDGRTDCYGLVRDFYHDVYGLNLRNYARPRDWWNFNLDLYTQNFEDEGFEVLPMRWGKVQVGDAFLMAIRCPHANHSAVYLGENRILHHFLNHLSVEEPINALWRSVTVAIVRHPVVKEKNREFFPAKKIDYMELLPPHVRRRLQSEGETPSSVE